MNLKKAISAETITLSLKGTTKEAVIEEMIDVLMAAGKIKDLKDRKETLKAVLDRERKIALEKATEEAAKTGKEIPADILAKRADGAAAKFAKDNALLSQVFVMDNKTPVAQVVEAAGKAAGTKIDLKDYVRFQLGEGIEKVESDFAAEVAAAAGLN